MFYLVSGSGKTVSHDQIGEIERREMIESDENDLYLSKSCQSSSPDLRKMEVKLSKRGIPVVRNRVNLYTER